MRDSVAAQWVATNTPLEGDLTFMYLDRLGYVTTGMGDLIDPIGMATALTWVNSDGSTASSDDVAAAWLAVDALRSDPKGQVQTSGPATQGGGTFGGYTTIRLTPDSVTQLVTGKLAQFETILKGRYPAWDSWPADAQWAVMSMSWAMGAAFNFPQFDAAMNAGNFGAAAPLSVFRGTGVQTRINDDELALHNAQVVVDNWLPREILYYPRQLTGATRAQLLAWATALAASVGIVVAMLTPMRERIWSWVRT